MAFIQQQNAVGCERRERDRFRRYLATGRRQNEKVIEERCGYQFGPACRDVRGDQGNVEPSVLKLFQERLGAVLADGESQFRQLRRQCGKDGGQEIGRHGGDEPKTDRAFWLARVMQREAFQRVGAAERFAGQFDEIPPERGQACAILEAVEQGRAAKCLQSLDLLGQGRLRN